MFYFFRDEKYTNNILTFLKSSFTYSFTYIKSMAICSTIPLLSFSENMKNIEYYSCNVLMTFQTIYYSTTEYIYYLICLQSFKEFVIRLIKKLSEINMLYTKLFQWVYLDSFFNDEDIKKVFQTFTDFVKIEEEEIDYMVIWSLLTKDRDLHFSSLKPFHAGTVSVTFEARLRDKPVIVKVLRKGIDKNLQKSVSFLLFIAKILSYLPYTCDFQLYDIMTENIDSLLSQSDLSIEGKQTEKFHNFLQCHEHLYSPRVYYFSKEIMVQEYVYGLNVYDLGQLEDSIRHMICSSVYEFIFHSMCELGTFHGDMHPGNVLFIVDKCCSSKTDDYMVNFIDYGITYEVKEEKRSKIMRIIWMLSESGDKEFFEFLCEHGIKSRYDSHIETNLTNVCKSKIVEELVELRQKYDVFRNTIKPLDIYYTNKVLVKYNLRIHPEFSRAFMFLYSMCSLMNILKSVDMTLYKKCLKVYFAMNHEKLKLLI